MFEYPKAIKDLIESLSLLPGVGKKTAERYAFAIINNFQKDEALELAENINNAVSKISYCEECGTICEEDKCIICDDDTRNRNIIIVVEDARDVYSIEKLDQYHGLFHVLNGVINFSKGISPSDLHIDRLIDRIKRNSIKEVILALNPTVEGEMTARYIKELLNDLNEVKVTRLAYGLPVGASLNYADEMTLLKALEGRIKYE